MKTVQRRSFSSAIPGYSQNAVLQLIVVSGLGFIMYHLTRVVLLIVEAKPETFPTYFTQNLALPHIDLFYSKFWTLFTYGWVHNGFWELFSNMIWLYAFGSVVQALVGYKQIIPMFIYSLIIGGVFYELAQFIPGNFFASRPMVFGSQAAITSLAVAALTIAPGYRFHLTPTFSIPLAVIAIIFFALMVMNSNLEGPALFLLAGGAVTGYSYVKLLQSGYKPGIWMYGIFDGLDRMATPDESTIRKQAKKRNEVLRKMAEKEDLTQRRVDEILDKINLHGYHSLTKEEKELLLKAGKDNDN